MDVLAFGAPDDAAIRAIIAEICDVGCPQDGLRFELSGMSVDVIREGEEYAGRWARFLAFLGSARSRFRWTSGSATRS